jgi:purine-binding chemotaxis protein CheW
METENNIKTNSYLSFKLGDEFFAVHAGKVLSILDMLKITRVPKSPDYMKGVVNLRGTVLPIIDTRIKLGMNQTDFTPNTCIIVLEVDVDNEPVKIGALVDAVQSVIEIKNDQIMPAPSIGSKYKSDFIIGVTNIDENFFMLLDVDAVFSTKESDDNESSTKEVA